MKTTERVVTIYRLGSLPIKWTTFVAFTVMTDDD
jgi:hypothetical protein